MREIKASKAWGLFQRYCQHIVSGWGSLPLALEGLANDQRVSFKHDLPNLHISCEQYTCFHCFCFDLCCSQRCIYYLIKAAITTLYSSRITTPILVFFLCLKTTPLKFTLYYSQVGGLHVITGLAPWASSCLTSFAAWYSSTRCNEAFKISLGLPLPPILLLLRSFHMPQKTEMNFFVRSSWHPSHFCWFCITSRKVQDGAMVTGRASLLDSHTPWACLQNHSKWHVVSSYCPHKTHSLSSEIFLRLRLSLVARIFWPTFHAKCLSLWGSFNCQIPF